MSGVLKVRRFEIGVFAIRSLGYFRTTTISKLLPMIKVLR